MFKIREESMVKLELTRPSHTRVASRSLPIYIGRSHPHHHLVANPIMKYNLFFLFFSYGCQCHLRRAPPGQNPRNPFFSLLELLFRGILCIHHNDIIFPLRAF